MKRALGFAVLSFLVAAAVQAAPPGAAVAPATPLAQQLGLVAADGQAVAPPLPIFLTGCEISRDCVCGGGTVTISCTGNTSCTFVTRGVKCDGVIYPCPSPGSCPP